MPALHRIDAEAREGLVTCMHRVLSGYPDVRFGVVFGSFLDAESFRDIDVGIWTTGSARSRLDLELATTLTAQLGMPIDVRRLNDAPVPFLFHALRGRAVAVRDEVFLADLMERTARDYHDRAPLLRRATVEAFAR